MKTLSRAFAPSALLALAGLAASLTSAASAQVVINEVYSNPPGSGSAADDRWEYIELYGPAGMNLTGYAIASVFGGGDPNGNNIPGPLPAGWDAGDEVPEIDEAWSLDGLTIGSNGLLVVYNANGTAANRPSLLPPFFAQATTSGTYNATHIPTVDAAGRIKNDGSANIVLLRKRPFHALDAQGRSLYDGVLGTTIVSGSGFPASIRYAWRKDINQDVNFNGRIDLNGIAPYSNQLGNRPAETPVNSERPATPGVPGPSSLEPYQMVDDIAWSNGGGKEYVRSSQQELSDTPNFNPDAVSRMAYFGVNPNRGDVLVSGVMKPTRMADEEFIYGDTQDLLSDLLQYSTIVIGGPTSTTSTNRYNALGQLDANGTFKLDRINLVGFQLTPGAFNDVDATANGGANNVQFRFVRGDFNFDGRVDCADYSLIQQRLGASLDDMAVILEDNNTITITDDVAYNGWRWQGRDFNATLAMVRMSTTDGTNGQWNSGTTVTAADVAATLALLPRCTQSDIAGPGPTTCPDGELTADDVILFISYFTASNLLADIASPGPVAGSDGELTADDIILFINRFTAGCN